MTSLATDNDSLVSPGFLGQQLPSFETKGNQGWGELSLAFTFVKFDHGWIGATLDSLSLNAGKPSLRFCGQVASLYNPGSDFRCFDGSNTIPFIQVNDDYCDCEVRDPTFLATFTWSLQCSLGSLLWSGWVRRARHLSLPQWQVLLWECGTQGLGHSLWQGEPLCAVHCSGQADLWIIARLAMVCVTVVMAQMNGRPGQV